MDFLELTKKRDEMHLSFLFPTMFYFLPLGNVEMYGKVTGFGTKSLFSASTGFPNFLGWVKTKASQKVTQTDKWEVFLKMFFFIFNSERHRWMIIFIHWNSFSWWWAWLARCLCSIWGYGGKFGFYCFYHSLPEFWRQTPRPSNQAHLGNVPISPLEKWNNQWD